MEIGKMHERVNAIGTKEYAYQFEHAGVNVTIWGKSRVAVQNTASLMEAAPKLKRAVNSIVGVCQGSLAAHFGEQIAGQITDAWDAAGAK